MKATLVRVTTSVALMFGALAGCTTNPMTPPTPTPPPAIGASVISTGANANEMTATLPPAVTDQWNALSASGKGVEWLADTGAEQLGRTPVAVGADASGALLERINGSAGIGEQRSVLSGLRALQSPAGSPVWVFSPLLDTRTPLDFRELAFDEAPPEVVKDLKKRKALPDLKGREVSFVIAPVAGAQQPMTDLQRGYVRAVWETLAKAAGAKGVAFYDGTGSTPGTGVGPAVPVPQPDEVETGRSGSAVVCTLPTPALFVINTPNLIDKKRTLRGLQKCLDQAPQNSRITVEGHTSGDPKDNGRATVELSKQRATVVAVLLRELDVPAKSIYKVVGYGRSKPLVEKVNDPRNRAVTVRFEVVGG